MGSLSIHPSPLRYPGGKGKISNFLKLLLLRNDLIGTEYAEPYAGGASVALSLLFEEYVSAVHINDLDRAVYSFWYAVLNHTEELCRKISDTPITIAEWNKQREVQHSETEDVFELGFSTFFLNRTNRSGILKAGVIGGKQQLGRWKLDARFNKDDLVKRIQKVARYHSRITLTCRDASALLRDWAQTNNTIVYLDPPYYLKGKGLYRNFYQHADHALVSQLVGKLACPWLVSYDAHPSIMQLYSGHAHFEYGLSYSAQLNYKGSEVMFFSPNLSWDFGVLPTQVTRKMVDSHRYHTLFSTH